MAYESLQAFKCPECGGWLWECSSEVSNTVYVSYNIHESYCRKTRAYKGYLDSKLDSKERAKTKDKNQWATIHRIEPYVDGKLYEGNC
jgi:hypothetical protein